MYYLEVSKTGQLKTIAEALQLVKGPTIITVGPGTYYEKLKITTDDVEIIGSGYDQTIITYDDYAKKIHADGLEYNTFRTYTVMILANNIKLRHLTITNSSGYGETIGQAVALSITGDNIELDDVFLDAYQDTLFAGPLPPDLLERYRNFLPADELVFPLNHRIYIHDSQIAGDVDFIFGCGNAFFENCTIICKERNGYITAPSTIPTDEYGFTFLNCQLKQLQGHGKYYLGRPWRDYGKVVFIDTMMENHVLDDGWNKWNDTNRDQTCRFYEYNSSYYDKHAYKRLYFGRQLTNNELENYTKTQVLRKKECK